jgi:type IV pilus assembly protein PilW
MNKLLRNKQRGIGLVELMIAITLSLVLTGAVVQIFVSSKNNYRVQDAVSGLQENGRFAINYLAQDIRMAGFMGCSTLDKISVNIIANGVTTGTGTALDPTSVFYSASSMLVGVDNILVGDATFGSAGLNAVPGTDALIIRRGVSGGGVLTGNLAAVNANIQIIAPNTLGLSAGDVILITDCANADLFRATNVSDGSGKETIAHSSSNNTSNNLSKPYGTDAEIIALQTTTYFVRDTGRKTPQGDHINALYVATRGAGQGGTATLANYTGELVEGVENMQLQYGVDNNVDGDNIANKADTYVDANAATDWSKVVSVRINLLMQSESSDVVPKTGTLAQTYKYGFSNTTITGSDGRLRQVYYTVVGIRNRLL